MTSSARPGPGVRPTIAYVSAQLPTYLAEEREVVPRSRAALEAQAETLGFELLAPWAPVGTRAEAAAVAEEAEAAGADLVLLQSSSFAMGDVVLPFLGRRSRLGLWAVEEPSRTGAIELNGLVSMHLHAGVARLAAPGAPNPYKWFFGLAAHPFFAPRLAVTVAALRAMKRLLGARIASIGGVAPSFLSLGVDETTLRRRLRVEVVASDLNEVFARARGLSAAEVEPEERALRGAARSIETAAADVTATARVALALRATAREAGAAALAVSDWPAFQEVLGIHPGAAFSWLDQRDALPVAAEGDVLGAATMLLARGLAPDDAGAMLLDVNDVDLAADALLAWHCGGSPLSWADAGGVAWVDHSTLGRKTPGAGPRGMVADLRFRTGAATVLRLRRSGRELLALDADVVEHPSPGFSGSRGWLGRFADETGPRSAADVLHTLMVHGVEHHLVLASGRRAAAAREVAAWLGLERTAVAPYRDELVVPEMGGRPCA